MVLFEFDEIIKDKYNRCNKNNNTNPISFDEFKIKCLKKFSELFPFYFSGINHNYIQNILASDKIHIIFYCIGNNFDIKNITSILIYHKTTLSYIIKYYILLLGTHERFRKYGYGKVILDEFIEFIKKINKSNKKIKIILKSLESSMDFYLSNGFIKSDLKSNKLFYKYETIYELKKFEEKILELNI